MLAILCRQTLLTHEQIREINRDLLALQKSDEMARLATIPGIGPIGATAFAAAVTDCINRPDRRLLPTNAKPLNFSCNAGAVTEDV
jgi:transposase